MKILRINSDNEGSSLGCRRKPSRAREGGSAVIVVLALLAIICAYVAFNTRTLHLLHRHVQLIEKQQLRRLAAANSGTNLVQRATPSFPTNSVVLQQPPL